MKRGLVALVAALLLASPVVARADTGGGGTGENPNGTIDDDGIGVGIDKPGQGGPGAGQPDGPGGPGGPPQAPAVGCVLPDGSFGVWRLPSGVIIRTNITGPVPPGAVCIPVPEDGSTIVDVVSLTDEQLSDMVPWPRAVIVLSPGDVRGLAGLRMGLRADGETSVSVSVAAGGITVTGTGQAVGWRWDFGDTLGDSGPTVTATPGTVSEPATWHVWPQAGPMLLAVTVTWTAQLTVTYPGGLVEERFLGQVDVTDGRTLPVWEAEAVIVNSE